MSASIVRQCVCGEKFETTAYHLRNERGKFCSRSCAYAERKRESLNPQRVAARFWCNVDKNGPVPERRPELGPCWLWTGCRDALGYGRFTFGQHHELAHRTAYRLEHGSIPDGLGVLHHCDNPPCCNPAHHFTGTMTDNMADKVAKGRQAKGDAAGARSKPERRPRGERHGMARLSDADVDTIRNLYQGRGRGPTQDELAERFGVSRGAINDVVRSRTRTQGEGAHPTRSDQRFKLTDDQVDEIRSSYRGPRQQPTQIDLAKRFGVTQAQIWMILRGKSRTTVTHEPSSTDDAGDQR